MTMTDNQIYISELSKTHLPEMMIIQHTCFEEIYREEEFVYETLIDVFPQGALGAFCDDKLIGYIFFHPYYYQTAKPLNSALKLTGDEDCMYLHEITVLPQYRSHGIPSRLIKEFYKVSEQYQMKYQSLVSVQNSIGFWEKKGFSVIREIEEGGYVDSFIMSKIMF